MRGVRVDAGVATTVADVWARAASVEVEKGGLNPAARDRTRDRSDALRDADHWASAPFVLDPRRAGFWVRSGRF